MYNHWFCNCLTYLKIGMALIVLTLVAIMVISWRHTPRNKSNIFDNGWNPPFFNISVFLFFLSIIVSAGFVLKSIAIQKEQSYGKFIVSNGKKKILAKKISVDTKKQTVAVNEEISYFGQYEYIYDIKSETKLSEKEIARKFK